MTYRGNLSKEDQERVKRLYELGTPERQIARDTGLPYGQVRGFVKTLRPQKEGTVPDELLREVSGTTAFRPYVWDLETTDLRSDIGHLYVAAFKNIATGEIMARTILDYEGTPREREEQLVEWTTERYLEADILIGHNSVSFDKNFLGGVRARMGLPHLPPKIHVDTMLVAQHGLKGRFQSVSMSNLADVLELETQKYQPSKNDWRESIFLDPEAMEEIKQRCIADITVQEQLYYRMRPYWEHWRGNR